MGKVGRNDPCPCGSGKKYKKCCIDKTEQIFEQKSFMTKDFLQYINGFWSYEEANEMSTAEIINQLKSMGIIFEKDVFLQDIEEFYSAEQISEHWFKEFRVTAEGRDEDFPFFAAWILWERLAPPQILSMEQMSDLIDQGFNYSSENNTNKACDIWLKVWEAIKCISKPEHKNLDFLDNQYQGSFFIRNFCQDLDNELRNAGMHYKTYCEKNINFCREFCDLFPAEEQLIIHNMKRSIAKSYSRLGNYQQAEWEFEKLVQDYPNNPWGYIGWGDLYLFDKQTDYDKARALYNKAIAIAQDKYDVMAAKERLEYLENEIKHN